MNYVVSEDGSTSRDPVYICIAESQLNSVMKNLESAPERCSRQSLAMVTTGHDQEQRRLARRAADVHLERDANVVQTSMILGCLAWLP
jgi:hypothetical protein